MLQVQVFTVNPVQENSYVLYNDAGDCCIIDPGFYFASEEKALTDFIQAHGLKPKLLLNTHCHLDHIFGNRFVHRTYGLELHLHPLDEQVLQRGPAMGDQWGLPFDNYDGPLHYLKEGNEIFLGADALRILFTPGHSPGSVCFYSEKDDFVIGGDVLFQGSIGRTDLPGGDFDTLANSIKTQLYVLPQKTKVYPGHGGPTTIGTEMKSNPFVKASSF